MHGDLGKKKIYYRLGQTIRCKFLFKGGLYFYGTVCWCN